jgi:hypothetical protein
MTPIRTTYLAAADVTARFLAEPAVAAAWQEPSALADMSVGALAAHLARQIFNVERVLAEPPATQAPISVLEHYARVQWIGAAHDDKPNVLVRETSAEQAAAGSVALAAEASAATGRLRAALAAQPDDRVVSVPWGSAPLTLDDLLVTRLIEITVHSDDLASSLGRPLPGLPTEAMDVAVSLLAQLAVRRHGPQAVLRALSRSERAPASVSAF